MKNMHMLGLVLCIACNQDKSDKIIRQESAVEKSVQSTTESANLQIGQTIIEGSVGVVSVTENITEKDTIRILDMDGSLWYKFCFFYDDSDGKFDYPNDNFRPLAFHPDYFLLALKVTKESDNIYEIIVNEVTGLKKILRKDKDFLLFQTWEEHILGVFSVDFDNVDNPLLNSPFEDAENVYYDSDEFYLPVQIKGDWLQLKWDSENNWEHGWIRWRNGEKLLVELYYFL